MVQLSVTIHRKSGILVVNPFSMGCDIKILLYGACPDSPKKPNAPGIIDGFSSKLVYLPFLHAYSNIKICQF